MSEIRIIAGSWETGPGRYEAGLLHLPNGDVRGVEDLADLSVAEPAGPVAQRRAGIAGGLRSALTAAGPLPRPLDLAASFVGLGLGVIGGDLHAAPALHARFTDGATAVIAADSATTALIVRDREVVRLAILRRSAAPPAPSRAPAPSALPDPGPERDADRALTSIFEYEKRKGRLRRLAAVKAPDET